MQMCGLIPTHADIEKILRKLERPWHPNPPPEEGEEGEEEEEEEADAVAEAQNLNRKSQRTQRTFPGSLAPDDRRVSEDGAGGGAVDATLKEVDKSGMSAAEKTRQGTAFAHNLWKNVDTYYDMLAKRRVEEEEEQRKKEEDHQATMAELE